MPKRKELNTGKYQPTHFGEQLKGAPKEHPRWSEEEGRILTYEEAMRKKGMPCH